MHTTRLCNDILQAYSDFFHTLCHAVILTFDLLTLNFYNTLGVLCLNSAQHLSEIIDDLARFRMQF